MIRGTPWWGILLLIGGQVLALEQTTQVMAIRDGIDQAVLRGDDELLAGYKQQLADAKGDWAVYYRAYIALRRSQFTATPKKVAKKQLNDCIDTLARLLERRPDMSEAYALQANCYGSSVRFYRLRAPARGSKANKAIEQALKLDSGNPRVLLQNAQSLAYRPAFFGGDKEKAMQQLQLAAELFVNWRSPDPEAPVWGEAEIWLTIGRLHGEAGDSAQARAALEKALDIAPNYRVAQAELEALG